MRVYYLKWSDDGKAIRPILLRSQKPHSIPIVAITIDRTSTIVAIGAADGTVMVLPIVSAHISHRLRGANVLTTSLHFFEIPGSAIDRRKGGGTAAPGPGFDSTEESGAVSTVNWRLAAGFQNGKVRVWDLHRRNCIATLESHDADVTSLDFSPSQLALVTASRDKTLAWWDVKSWKPRLTVPCWEQAEATGFVEDGRLTYSAGEKGWLRFWETDTGREVSGDQAARAETEAIVRAVYWPGLPFIICVQMDHTIALYRPPSREEESQLKAPAPFRRISGTHDEILDMAYLTPSKNFLALATNSEDIRIVSVLEPAGSSIGPSSPAQIPYFGQDVGLLKGHEATIIALDIDWSGYWIATGSRDNTARLWRVDPQNGVLECYATFTGHTESLGAIGLPKTVPPEASPARIDPLSHAPPFLITGSKDLTVKRWKIPARKQEVKQGTSRAQFTRKAHEKDINAIDVHANGILFASASQDKTVKIWSIEEDEVLGVLRGHRRGVWTVKFAPANLPTIQGEENTVAGRGVVLTGSGDKTLRLWNLADYTCIRTFEGHSNSVLKLAWLNVPAPQDLGKRPILAASAGGDGLVKVWDVNSGEAECTLDNHEDRVWALSVHPETNMIVSGGGDSTITFWRDTTAETQAAEAEAAEKLVRQEQELENRVRTGQYREAISLALQLNHPGRLLNLFTTVVYRKDPEPGSMTGLHAVDRVLAGLSDDQIYSLLLRLRDWNANARTARVAQRVLATMLRSYPPEKLANLKVRGAKGQQSLREVLRALRAYTERHYKRVEEMIDDSYLVEYTLQKMDGMVASDRGKENVPETGNQGRGGLSSADHGGEDSEGDFVMI
jgi:U3 small nucleolar RNA-associated protein 13